MKFISILKICASLGPVGYLPAPGTLATVLTSVLLFLVPIAWWLQIITIAIAWIIVYGAFKYGYYKNNDPSEIVLDEVAGTFVTFFGMTLNWPILIIGFLLFRFFDVLKPLGIKKVESIGGSTGIMLDDIVAGVVSTSIVRIIHYYLLTL